MKLKMAANASQDSEDDSHAAAALATPRCHPDAASLPRRTKSWRSSIAHNAMGWRMAERWQQAQLLPGDALEIAFSLDYNDHPDFGGLELTLRDFKVKNATAEGAEITEAQPQRA